MDQIHINHRGMSQPIGLILPIRTKLTINEWPVAIQRCLCAHLILPSMKAAVLRSPTRMESNRIFSTSQQVDDDGIA